MNQYKDTFLHCLKRSFINPFSIIFFILGMISFFTDALLSGIYASQFNSTIIIFSMLIISGIIRLTQELKAKKISDDLTTLVQTTCLVLRDGIWKELSSSKIVVGDQIRLEAGDQVPADIRLVETNELYVSQSMITGESTITKKSFEPIKNPTGSMIDYTNILFAGTTITGGNAKGIVIAVGSDTIYGGLNINPKTRKQGFDKGANSIAWVMVRFMMILVPIVFISSGLTKENWLQAFLFALSVAVGLIPELLPMVVKHLFS